MGPPSSRPGLGTATLLAVKKPSLDQVIATMRETGRDMQSKYKETSTGGLAINVTEC